MAKWATFSAVLGCLLDVCEPDPHYFLGLQSSWGPRDRPHLWRLPTDEICCQVGYACSCWSGGVQQNRQETWVRTCVSYCKCLKEWFFLMLHSPELRIIWILLQIDSRSRENQFGEVPWDGSGWRAWGCEPGAVCLLPGPTCLTSPQGSLWSHWSSMCMVYEYLSNIPSHVTCCSFQDGSGTIDFREYVIGLHLITEPANNEETIQFAFQVRLLWILFWLDMFSYRLSTLKMYSLTAALTFQLFDVGNKGHITQEELADMLQKAFGMHDVDCQGLFSKVDTDNDGHISYGGCSVMIGIMHLVIPWLGTY